MIKFMPKDRFGRIPAISWKNCSMVLSWPRDGMAWFFWGNGVYRVGPVTVIFHRTLHKIKTKSQQTGEVQP